MYKLFFLECRGYSFIVPGCIICGMALIVFLFLVVGESSVALQLNSPYCLYTVIPFVIFSFRESLLHQLKVLLLIKIKFSIVNFVSDPSHVGCTPPQQHNQVHVSKNSK